MHLTQFFIDCNIGKDKAWDNLRQIKPAMTEII